MGDSDDAGDAQRYAELGTGALGDADTWTDLAPTRNDERFR